MSTSRAQQIAQSYTPEEIVEELNKANRWLIIAGIAAFVASAFFVIKYFVGGDMHPENWTWEQWLNAALGAGITAVITAAQAFLYRGGYKGAAAIIGTCVVVAFGFFSEVSQSMEREDYTVRYRSENSEVYKAALSVAQSQPQINIQVPASLKAASSKVAELNTRIANKNACNSCEPAKFTDLRQQLAIAEAKLAAEQTAFNAQTSALSSVAGAAQTKALDKAKELEYDEDKHYAMIRFIQAMFGVVGIMASFMFSSIIIGTFEYTFHFIGNLVADFRAALRLLGFNAKGERLDSYAININAPELNTAPINPQPSPIKDTTTKTNPNPFNKVPNGAFATFTQNIGNALADDIHRANTNRARIYDSLATTLSPKPQAPTPSYELLKDHDAVAAKAKINAMYADIKPNVRGHSEPALTKKQIRDYLDQLAPQIAVYRHDVESGALPLDHTNRAAIAPYIKQGLPDLNDRTVAQLIQPFFVKALTQDWGQTMPSTPSHEPKKPNGHNPALGTHEVQLDMYADIEPDVRGHSNAPNVRGHSNAPNVRPTDINKELIAALKDAQSKMDADTLREAMSLYPQYKAALMSAHIKPNVRDGKSFVNEHLCQGRTKTVTPAGMESILKLWGIKGLTEGLFIKNPKYTGKPPHPQYLLNPNYQEQQ